MKANMPLPSYKVSTVNCMAVKRFKQEKINRDKGVNPGGGGGGGNQGGGSNPGRGDDPMSLCADDPDNCEEVELVCTSVTVTSPFGSTTTGWECEYLH